MMKNIGNWRKFLSYWNSTNRIVSFSGKYWRDDRPTKLEYSSDEADKYSIDSDESWQDDDDCCNPYHRRSTEIDSDDSEASNGTGINFFI